MPVETARPYETGDEKQLVALYQTVFKRDLSLDEWRWRLKTAPSPAETVFVGVVGERIVACYGGSPRRCRIPGMGERWVMAGCDAMTSPEVRRQGWLTRVGQLAHRTWAESGVAFELAIPGPNWRSRVEALGFVPLFSLRDRMHPTAPATLLSGIMGAGALRWLDRTWEEWCHAVLQPDPRIECSPLSGSAVGLEEWFRRVQAEATRAEFVHDRSWMEWRYLAPAAPRARILVARRRAEVVGYVVTRLEGRTGTIVELSALDNRITRSLIWTACRALRDDSAARVVMLVPERSSLLRQLLRTGFLFSRPSLTARICPFDDSLPRVLLGDPSRFPVGGGDFEF